RKDRDQIAVEVLPLSNYIKSAEEHQQHLEKYPEDMHMCHISKDLLNKYK
ncbi:peptide-methionine (S)-S-oxide reductase, partial [Escherichia coli]